MLFIFWGPFGIILTICKSCRMRCFYSCAVSNICTIVEIALVGVVCNVPVILSCSIIRRSIPVTLWIVAAFAVLQPLRERGEIAKLDFGPDSVLAFVLACDLQLLCSSANVSHLLCCLLFQGCRQDHHCRDDLDSWNFVTQLGSCF